MAEELPEGVSWYRNTQTGVDLLIAEGSALAEYAASPGGAHLVPITGPDGDPLGEEAPKPRSRAKKADEG